IVHSAKFKNLDVEQFRDDCQQIPKLTDRRDVVLVCELHRNFNDGNAEPPAANENLDVEEKAVRIQLLEYLRRGAPRKAFQAALRVARRQAEQQAHERIK